MDRTDRNARACTEELTQQVMSVRKERRAFAEVTRSRDPVFLQTSFPGAATDAARSVQDPRDAFHVKMLDGGIKEPAVFATFLDSQAEALVKMWTDGWMEDITNLVDALQQMSPQGWTAKQDEILQNAELQKLLLTNRNTSTSGLRLNS